MSCVLSVYVFYFRTKKKEVGKNDYSCCYLENGSEEVRTETRW